MSNPQTVSAARASSIVVTTQYRPSGVTLSINSICDGDCLRPGIFNSRNNTCV